MRAFWVFFASRYMDIASIMKDMITIQILNKQCFINLRYVETKFSINLNQINRQTTPNFLVNKTI